MMNGASPRRAAGPTASGGGTGAVVPPRHALGGRLVAVRFVCRGEVEPGRVALVGGPRQPLPDQPAEVVEEPQLRALVPGRLDGLFAPLQHALGLGERPFL